MLSTWRDSSIQTQNKYWLPATQFFLLHGCLRLSKIVSVDYNFWEFFFSQKDTSYKVYYPVTKSILFMTYEIVPCAWKVICKGAYQNQVLKIILFESQHEPPLLKYPLVFISIQDLTHLALKYQKNKKQEQCSLMENLALEPVSGF